MSEKEYIFVGRAQLKTRDYIHQIEHENRELKQEIERLKQGYCPIKEKCNKGECDCTNEEYNQMCEENIKLDEKINKAIGYIEENCTEHGNEESMWFYRTINADNVLNILKGVDKE